MIGVSDDGRAVQMWKPNGHKVLDWVEQNLQVGDDADEALQKLHQKGFQCKPLMHAKPSQEEEKSSAYICRKNVASIPFISVKEVVVSITVGSGGTILEVEHRLNATYL
jgi:hypothetical protein